MGDRKNYVIRRNGAGFAEISNFSILLIDLDNAKTYLIVGKNGDAFFEMKTDHRKLKILKSLTEKLLLLWLWGGGGAWIFVGKFVYIVSYDCVIYDEWKPNFKFNCSFTSFQQKPSLKLTVTVEEAVENTSLEDFFSKNPITSTRNQENYSGRCLIHNQLSHSWPLAIVSGYICLGLKIEL